MTESLVRSSRTAPRARRRATFAPVLAPALLGALFLASSCQQLERAGAPEIGAATPVLRPSRLAQIDVQHYAIELALAPQTRTIEGSCRVRLQAVAPGQNRVVLDLAGLEVRSVRDDKGRDLPYEHKGEKLEILLAELLMPKRPIELQIAYGGQPAKGLWFAGERNGQPTHVFTQGQCEDSRWWFPCIDEPADRATTEVRVTMPAEWVGIAAGDLVERTESEGVAVEHWRMDFAHPAYLTTLVAGRFAIERGEWEGVPLLYAAEPKHAQLLAPNFAETGDVLTYFSDLTGVRYPYSKYAQTCVDNFPFGGMENISASTLTDRALRDERGRRDGQATGLIAHEAAHQWYGNLLTCADWSHAWLNEGLATYLSLLYFEATRGADDFRARMRDAQERYVNGNSGEERRPLVTGEYTDPMDLFGNGRIYEGGAARLHLLRHMLGDEAFFAGLRAYTEANRGRGVLTHDLQRAMEKASGVELTNFFQQWCYSSGHPEFEVAWSHEPQRGILVLRVDQVQRGERGTPVVFRVPVEVEIRDEGGSAVHRLEIDQRREVYELPCPRAPQWLVFDRAGAIPKQLTQSRSSGEWMALLRSNGDVNWRRDAARALGELAQRSKSPAEHEVYVAALVERVLGDSSEHVRREAVTALGQAGGAEAAARLEFAGSSDESALVRTAALRALLAFGPSTDRARFAREEYQRGYSWKTMGAAAALVCAADPANAYDWLNLQLLVDSPGDVLRCELVAELGRLENSGVVDQLVRWAQDESSDPAARAAAVQALRTRGSREPQVLRALEGLLATEHYALRRSAIEALAAFGEPRARTALQTYYPRSIDSREKRVIEAALRRRGTGG